MEFWLVSAAVVAMATKDADINDGAEMRSAKSKPGKVNPQ